MENPIAECSSLEGVREWLCLRQQWPGKLEQDVLERGCTEVGQLLSGAHFPAQVCGDLTTYSATAEMGSRSGQDQ